MIYQLPAGLYADPVGAAWVAAGMRALARELAKVYVDLPPDGARILAIAEAVAAGAPIPLVVDPPPERWLSAEEAARRRGCSPEWIRALARAGRIRARRPGWVWEIAESAVPAASSVRKSVGTGSEPGAA